MKIKISRKNILKENCGDPAPPVDGVERAITPSEDSPAAGDVSGLSPEEAFDAGYAAAISELSAMIGEMMPGGDPVDSAALPAEIEVVDQLEEDDDWIQKAVDPDHEGYCTPMTKKTCTPRRKALAKRFKKAAKKKETKGGTGWQGKV